MSIVEFASIAAEGSNLDVGVIEEAGEDETAESTCGAGDADIGDFALNHGGTDGRCFLTESFVYF